MASRGKRIIYNSVMAVEYHWLDNEGRWQHAQVSEGGQIPLECPAVTLSVEEIYEDIRF